jgi:hypothetical protein
MKLIILIITLILFIGYTLLLQVEEDSDVASASKVCLSIAIAGLIITLAIT